MLTALQAWSAAHMLLAAAVAIAASVALRQRRVSAQARAAANALRVFWAGLGGTALVQFLMLVLAAMGAGDALALPTTLLAYATSIVALGALAAYIAFLFTGSPRAVPLVAALYGLVFLVAAWSVLQSQPTDLRLTRWSFEPAYAREPSAAVAAAPALAALLPAIVGAVAFVVLGLRSTGATRQRGLLVGTALALWFGSTLFTNTGAEGDAAHLAQRLASLAGILAIYLAYLPPRALQERWGLVGLGQEHRYHEVQAEAERSKKRAGERLRTRVHELV